MTEKDEATIGPMPYNLPRFEEMAADYARAKHLMMQEFHFALAHIDKWLRVGGLYASTVKPPKATRIIGLPWDYGFSVERLKDGGVSYNLSWGADNRSVLHSSVTAKNLLVPSYDQWALVTLEEDIRDGLLDQVAEYALATEQERIELLDSGHPHGHTETDVFVFGTNAGTKPLGTDHFSFPSPSLN